MLPDDPPLPPWAPPRAPLPPLRLAKLANAFGVPLPALHPPSLRTPPLSPSPPPAPAAPPSSRYLLHVIPPLCLPHSSDDPRFTPPPSSASGYHTRYRRGVLVPVYANFQAQLAAIAREYALPSTAGIILYLVSSSGLPDDEQASEPGPRISEDIWKHIWTRVVSTEQLPQLYRLGGMHSTASISRGDGSHLPHPRPLLSGGVPKPPSSASTFAPSSSTSSSSDLRLNSTSSSVADPDTPDTSSSEVDETATKADAYVLPGLNSPSLIPVLAKVEFDIDRKKARWYEPWLKSRRLNQAKRVQTSDDEQGGGNRHPLALLTATKGAAVPHVNDSELDVLPNHTKRSIPSPLVLVPDAQGIGLAIPCEHITNPSAAGSVHLAYLNEPSTPNTAGGSDEELDAFIPFRKFEESEKRGGAIFDDLDLGLGASVDFDDDRRKSQLLMKAKLDEIEKAMMQLSPRELKDTLEEDATVGSLSPSQSTHPSPSPSRAGDVRIANVRRTDEDVFDPQNQSQAWPAVPYAALKESMNPVQADVPQLAVNGITTALPLRFVPPTRSSSYDVPSETQRRKKELMEYSPGLAVEINGKGLSSDFPIPLSPDPFGRYPSSNVGQNGAASGSASNTATVSSRFSVDSTDEVASKPNNRTTLSMKSIKNLWRKSDKSSQSNILIPPTGRSSLSQPSQEELNLPPVPDIPSSRISPTPGLVTSRRPSVEQLSVISSTNLSRSSSPFSQLPRMPSSPHHFKSPPPSPTPVQATPETRKSILKWRSKSRGGSISQNSVGPYESRASFDQSRPSSSASIGRRPSVNGLNPGHVPMSSADIPPNPRIPEHFLNDLRQARPLLSVASPEKRQSIPNGRQTRSPTDSPTASERPTGSLTKSPSPSRVSTASSRDSHGTQPSFDASQFEMVSPKIAALTYPYHGFDHE